MGKIFGISDLPVSTIMTPFEPIYIAQGSASRVKSGTANKYETAVSPLIRKKHAGIKTPKCFSKLATIFSRKIIK